MWALDLNVLTRIDDEGIVSDARSALAAFLEEGIAIQLATRDRGMVSNDLDWFLGDRAECASATGLASDLWTRLRRARGVQGIVLSAARTVGDHRSR